MGAWTAAESGRNWGHASGVNIGTWLARTWASGLLNERRPWDGKRSLAHISAAKRRWLLASPSSRKARLQAGVLPGMEGESVRTRVRST